MYFLLALDLNHAFVLITLLTDLVYLYQDYFTNFHTVRVLLLKHKYTMLSLIKFM